MTYQSPATTAMDAPITPRGVDLSALPAIPTASSDPAPRFLPTDPQETMGDVYASLQEHRIQEWVRTVARYEAHPQDFFTSYHFVKDHPIFYSFLAHNGVHVQEHERYLEVDGISRTHLDVVRVCPQTDRIEEDESLNTRTEVWFETGPWLWPSDMPHDSHIPANGIGQHDWEMDGGAPTYEDAIVLLARRIHNRYGTDRQKVEP